MVNPLESQYRFDHKCRWKGKYQFPILTPMKNLFDEYSFKARLMPTFLVLLPAALAAWVWTESIQFDWKILGGILVYCGCTFLLSQLGRDLGRQKQEKLFKLWGGKPTTRLLRHRTKVIEAITLQRYHAKLEKLTGHGFPDKDREVADKRVADTLYESGVKILLERTRYKDKFPLVFKENINYGFRRNLWAMKPAGIFICCTSLAGSVARIWIALYHENAVPLLAILSAVFAVIFLTLWVLRITPKWVQLASEAYAIRLLAASEDL
jgi:hypothetical protein